MSNSAGCVRVHGHHQEHLQRVLIQPHNQFHRITEMSQLERTSGVQLVQTSARSRTWAGLCRSLSPYSWTLPFLWATYTKFNCSHAERFLAYIQMEFALKQHRSLLPLVLLPCSLVATVPPPSPYLHFKYWKVVIISPHPELPFFYKQTQFLHRFFMYQVLQLSSTTHKSKLRH